MAIAYLKCYARLVVQKPTFYSHSKLPKISLFIPLSAYRQPRLLLCPAVKRVGGLSDARNSSLFLKKRLVALGIESEKSCRGVKEMPLTRNQLMKLSVPSDSYFQGFLYGQKTDDSGPLASWSLRSTSVFGQGKKFDGISLPSVRFFSRFRPVEGFSCNEIV